MEIVSLPTASTRTSGGTKKHVEEWSRLDRLTGMLEHARVEADHWASNTSNSRHHFGKVVDCRARNLADGSVQQKQQMKQLEVFQAHIPGGSVQVIRSHTSTSSSWHTSRSVQNSSSDWPLNMGNNSMNRINEIESQIDDLKLDHNLVNFNTEKAKANVARSMINRRPPTRNKTSKISDEIKEYVADAREQESLEKKRLITPFDSFVTDFKPTTLLNEGDASEQRLKLLNGTASGDETDDDTKPSRRRQFEKLEKKKSVSDENLSVTSSQLEKEYENETDLLLSRGSKTRLSFQYPAARAKSKSDIVENSKNELQTTLEKVWRLNGNIENVAKTARASCTAVDDETIKPASSSKKPKSFVTEETLKEMKQKLRRLNNGRNNERVESSSSSSSANQYEDRSEETDDGIFTESKGSSDKEDDRAKSPPPPPTPPSDDEKNRTASVECRTINKSDEWFDRRKSYGFETVYGVQRSMATSAAKSMHKTNLSTDSGICQSSELELVSTPIGKKLETGDELASTSIVRKLTEANEERLRKNELADDKCRDGGDESKSADVSELCRKFEQKVAPSEKYAGEDKSRNTTFVTVNNDEQKIRFADAAAFETRHEIKTGKIAEAIQSLRDSSAGSSFESISAGRTNEKTRFADVDQDLLLKRHSIACDDAKFISKFSSPIGHPFRDKLSSNSLALDHPNTVVVNVNNVESGGDVKKPKKVEFSKTEVHFAAAEPGKIKIVETNEKPPSANLYRRKKRSLSVSPKLDLPQTKFGDEKLVNDTFEDEILRNRTKAAAKSDETRPNSDRNETTDAFRDHFTSSTSDNGFEVTISSIKPNENRWSAVDYTPQSKPGYSTKVNFKDEGITVVADANTLKQHENVRDTEVPNNYKTVTHGLNASRNGFENFQEKLIVRIGDSGGSCAARLVGGKHAQQKSTTFSDSFRNSINDCLNPTKSDLKSTSLIINTIRKSTNANVRAPIPIPGNANSSDENGDNKGGGYVETEKMPNDLKTRDNDRRRAPPVEQPSTYITEMNKLQQKYRADGNRSTIENVAAARAGDKIKTRIYNTVPGTKNGHRPKILADELPLMLSAFDSLCETIDQAIGGENEIRTVRGHLDGRSSTATKNCERYSYSDTKLLRRSSRSSWLVVTGDDNDGDVSDDSLKADEEVRSYMSTATMEEYENELSGSWSRKKYFKHIKPVKTIKDEISDKSHFKPLQREDERLKIVTSTKNIVDIKRPKITSVAVRLDENSVRVPAPKKLTTVLLNNNATRDENASSSTLDDVSASAPNKLRCDSPNKINYADSRKIENESPPDTIKITAKDVKPPPEVKVIYHGIHILDDKETTRQKKLANDCQKCHTKRNNAIVDPSVNDSTRRKGATPDKEKLFNTGRDAWLNLPKERKVYTESAKQLGRRTTSSGPKTKDSAIRQNGIVTVNESALNGVTNTSEEDTSKTNNSGKSYSKRLSTISEKSNVVAKSSSSTTRGKSEEETKHMKLTKVKWPVTRTTSNSSADSRCNAREFKNPVLKTEERSKRRAARMLHTNAATSSEEIMSENEANCLQTSRSRHHRKPKTSKSTKTILTANGTVWKPNYNRITQHSTAKMQINIFNFKERPNDTKHSKSRSNPTDNIISKSRSQQDQQNEVFIIPCQKNKSSKSKMQNSKYKDTKKLSTVSKRTDH